MVTSARARFGFEAVPSEENPEQLQRTLATETLSLELYLLFSCPESPRSLN